MSVGSSPFICRQVSPEPYVEFVEPYGQLSPRTEPFDLVCFVPPLVVLLELSTVPRSQKRGSTDLHESDLFGFDLSQSGRRQGLPGRQTGRSVEYTRISELNFPHSLY